MRISRFARVSSKNESLCDMAEACLIVSIISIIVWLLISEVIQFDGHCLQTGSVDHFVIFVHKFGLGRDRCTSLSYTYIFPLIGLAPLQELIRSGIDVVYSRSRAERLYSTSSIYLSGPVQM